MMHPQGNSARNIPDVIPSAKARRAGEDRIAALMKGVIGIAGFILAIASPTIASGATIEEVAHCRAIPQLPERLNCFKSLKPGPRAKTEDAAPAKKQDAAPANGSSKVKGAARAKAKQAAPAKTEQAVEQPAPAKTEQVAPAKMDEATPANRDKAAPAKTERAAPAKKQDAGSSKVKDAARAKAKQAAPAKAEQAAPAKTDEAAPANRDEAAPAKTDEAVPAKTEQAAPAKTDEAAPKTDEAAPAKTVTTTQSNTGEALFSPMPDDPGTISSIDRLSVAGQPLCVDIEALAAMLVAGLLTANPKNAATHGCKILPEDAKLELLERYPSVFPSIRIVRVRVTSPTQPDLTFGFSIETGR
jgi:hypothetical protein